jgi:hypothetical protein
VDIGVGGYWDWWIVALRDNNTGEYWYWRMLG